MVPRLSHLSSLNCESYQLGKHTRVSFPKHSGFRAESPFHLVHTDVWGPSRSPSISEAFPAPYLGPNDCVSSAPLPNLLADTVDVTNDSPSVPTPSRASNLASPPILRRGTRSTRNPYPIYTFLSYHRLSSPYYAFVSSLSSISVPKSTSDALAHPGWRQAMIDEMNALHTNGTWELVSLPSGKFTVGCKWVYTVKVYSDGSVDRLKARLVAKGYTQVYGMLDSKPVDTPMDPNTKLVPDEGELLTNPEQYRRLVGKLNYLTVTRPDIAFATSMGQPIRLHWAVRELAQVQSLASLSLLFGRGHATLSNKHHSSNRYSSFHNCSVK
ncbi:Retrovirus-related pol polyprotein from transposon tnt 1-94 [Quillaja saponaria]|uniref:Retrovirus-related pol polyprotein from transposon tnt 1-94 n=1 Tax=Quillaja saponaria TaxID=32244 RepID=A0AAD7VNY8_QUISA|nr:Retrovirus-related pol polyprotein from transposon tnt 1-94 [Quillaja saponaria]